MNSKLLLSYISPYLSEDQNSFEKEIYTSDLLEKMNLVGSKSKENREKIKRKMPFTRRSMPRCGCSGASARR